MNQDNNNSNKGNKNKEPKVNQSEVNKNKKFQNLQFRRLIRQERENRELRKQVTTLLNYQKEMEKRLEILAKNSEKEQSFNKEVRKNNQEIDAILRENKKYIKEMQDAEQEGDEERVRYYKKFLKDNDIEIKRLKKLNKDIKKNSKDLDRALDEVNENLESISDNIETSNTTLADMLDTFNIMEMKDSLEERLEGQIDSLQDINETLGNTKEESAILNKALKREIIALNKTYGENRFGADEFFEATQQLIDAGIKDTETLVKFVDEVAQFNKLNANLGNAVNLLQYSSEESLQSLGNVLAQFHGVNGVDNDAIVQLVDEISPAFNGLDEATKQELQRQFVTAAAVMQQHGMGDSTDEMSQLFADWVRYQKTGDTSVIDELSSKYGINATKLMYAKDFTSLMNEYFNSVNMAKMYGSTAEVYGVDSATMDWAKLNGFDPNLFTQGIQDALSQDISNAMFDRIDNQRLTLTEQTSNTLGIKSLDAVNWLEEKGFEWEDVKSIKNAVITGIAYKDFIKPLLGKIFGKGTATVAAQGASTVASKGLLSKIGNLFSRGGVIGRLGTGLKTAGKWLISGLGSLGGWISKSLSSLGGALSRGLGSIGSSLGTKLGNLVPKLGGISSALTKGLSKIGSFLGTYGGWIAALIGIVKGSWDISMDYKDWYDNLTPEEQKEYQKEAVRSYEDPLDPFKKQEQEEKKQSKSQYNVYNKNKNTGSVSFSNQDIGGMFRSGLDEVPYDGFKAVLHSGEKVLTKEDAEVYDRHKSKMDMWEHNAQQSKSLLGKIASKENIQAALTTKGEQLNRLNSFSQSQTSSSSPSDSTTPGGGGIVGDDFIGAYTVKHETGSSGLDGGGMVSSGKNDPLGGISYGIPQYSTKQGSAKEFRDWLVKNYPEYNQYLGGKTPGTAAFGQGWKDAFAKYGHEFSKLQLKYNYSTGYDKWVAGSLRDYGVNFNKNRAFQEVAYSMATQHGPAGYKKYVKGLSSSLSDTEFLKKLYQNRINKAAVPTTKRWNQELQEMLALVGQPALAYKQGTPYVPEDQIAMLHKGEMVVPEEHNPMSRGKTLQEDDNLDEIIKLLKWGFNYLGQKLSEEKVVQEVNTGKKLRSLKDIYENVKLER